MGRDVQFFVIPDLSSVQSGSGNFKSEMVKKTETTEKKVTEATTQSVTVSVNTETTEKKITKKLLQANRHQKTIITLHEILSLLFRQL